MSIGGPLEILGTQVIVSVSHTVKNCLHILTELHFWEVNKEKG